MRKHELVAHRPAIFSFSKLGSRIAPRAASCSLIYCCMKESERFIGVCRLSLDTGSAHTDAADKYSNMSAFICKKNH